MLEKIINHLPFKKTIVASALLFGLGGCNGDTITNNYFYLDKDVKENIIEPIDIVESNQDLYSADVTKEEEIKEIVSQDSVVDVQDLYSMEVIEEEEIEEIISQDYVINKKGCSDLSQYPDCFVENGIFQGYFVVGENAASIDSLSMTDIAASMKYVNENGMLKAVEVVDAVKLDSEIADVYAQNLIVIGNPCVNTISAELLGNPADCTEGFIPGQARIKLFQNGEYSAMLVAGYSGIDTRLAAKVIAHRWNELSGQEMIVEGTTYSDATIGLPEVIEEE